MSHVRSLFLFVLFGSVLAAGCGVVAGADVRRAPPGGLFDGARELVVGIGIGQPHIGVEAREGVYEGLDVDVARYVARELGFGPERVRFVEVEASERARMLLRGRVDMVVATYPVTPEAGTRIQFAGPYFVARQDIVVRDGTRRITGVRSLEGVRMCAARGTDAYANIRALGVRPVERFAPSWADCLLQLKAGKVDAVSAADAIIAGYMRYRSRNLRLLGESFTEERWGIGMRERDVRACEQANRAITRMYAEGAALAMQREWFEGTGLRLTTDVPQFEGCG